MKLTILKLTFISLSLTLFSCHSLTKQEELIKKHVETNRDGAIVDMHFKSKRCEKIKELKGSDSLDTLASTLSVDKSKFLAETDNLITASQNKYDKFASDAKGYDKDIAECRKKETLGGEAANNAIQLRDMYEGYKKTTLEAMDIMKEKIAEYKALKDKYKYYTDNKDKVVGNVWECNFTVLQGTTDYEYTLQYLFNPDNTTIIKKL